MAIALNNFAVLMRDEGRYREAAALLETVVHDTENSGPSATAIANLAEIYRREGYVARAEALITRSMDTDDPSAAANLTVVRLRRLAMIDHARQRYPEAQVLLEQALALATKADDTQARADILEELASVRRDSRQYAEASKLYDEALLILERDDPESPSLAYLLDNIADLMLKQNRLTEAETRLLRAKRIYDRVAGADQPIGANVLQHLGMLYRDQKRWNEANAAFKRSIEMQEKAMSPEAPVLAQTLVEYAQLCRLQNRTQEAAGLEVRARKIALNAEAEPAPRLPAQGH